jgi:ABC-type nitrate/sulfonate/bicarbonate transport system substrate-binding protein
MAAPNLLNLGTITGKTAKTVLTTSDVEILENAASSNTVLKINTITLANIDGASTPTANVAITDEDGNSPIYIVKTITVPPDSTIIVIDKNTPIYLEEDMSIYAKASIGSDVDIIISYEILAT